MISSPYFPPPKSTFSLPFFHFQSLQCNYKHSLCAVRHYFYPSPLYGILTRTSTYPRYLSLHFFNDWKNYINFAREVIKLSIGGTCNPTASFDNFTYSLNENSQIEKYIHIKISTLLLFRCGSHNISPRSFILLHRSGEHKEDHPVKGR